VCWLLMHRTFEGSSRVLNILWDEEARHDGVICLGVYSVRVARGKLLRTRTVEFEMR